MTFAHPLLLLLAPALAVLLGGVGWFARRRRLRAAAAWSPALGAEAARRGRWVPLLLGGAGALAGLALADPRGGERVVTTEARALDLVFALDVSRSMLAEDVAPSRLRRAAREAARLAEDLAGDRLGLVAFAGRGYILSPLTVDGGALRLYLDALDPDIASDGGTSLAAALQQGEALLGTPTDGADRVLVVFSDGEVHDSLEPAVAAARRLAERGVHLILVGEGGTAPARIPLRDPAGSLIEYKLDDAGQVVRTARRDDVLRAVADAGSGSLVGSDLPDQAGAVRELVRTLRRRATRESRTADLAPLAWVPALGAAGLLLAASVASGGGALAALLLVLLPASVAAQRPSPADRRLADGDLLGAARRYLQHRGGLARDSALFNAGSAALAAGDLASARTALAAAAGSVDPELRQRALYNLGTAALLAARQEPAQRQALLQEARTRLKEALLLAPADADAKWNLELTQAPSPPSSGGGPSPPPPQGSPPPPKDDLNRNQAEQILGSMEREELQTQMQRQRRAQSVRRAGKDW